MGWKEFRAGGKERRKRILKFIYFKVAAVVVLGLILIKPFPFLYPLVPGKLRNMAKYWTYDMLWAFVKSGGTRVMADQPSFPRMPSDFKPKAKVAPEWAISEEQVRFFFENGFLGPLKLYSPEEMAEVLHEVEADVFEPGESGFGLNKAPEFTRSQTYDGIRQGRDRHLDSPTVLKLSLQQGIADRIAQLMGPDLLLWRTQLLPKEPGAAETAWHQASTFTMSGKMLRPVIEPPDRDEFFDCTAWLALEDVDYENGAMQFWRGSHRKPLHLLKIGGEQKFAATSFKLLADIPPDEVTTMALKAGEFVIFHERTVHGAPPNSSKTRRRFGMNYRVSRPDVFIYRNVKVQISNTFAETFDMKNWAAILLRGEDRFRRNKVKLQSDVIREVDELAAKTREKELVGV